MKNLKLTFDDHGPDRLNRRRFTLEWEATGGEYRKELGKDGKPVGMRRGQCFFSDQWKHFKATGEGE